MQKYRDNKIKEKRIKNSKKENTNREMELEVLEIRKNLQGDVMEYLELVVTRKKLIEKGSSLREIGRLQDQIEDKQIKISEIEEYIVTENYKKVQLMRVT